MSIRGDQVAQIGLLLGQGKSIEEIAGTVGLEMGDVQSVLAGATRTYVETLEGGLPTVGGGGGGPTPGAVVVHKFPFAFDTPGLEDGVDIYTPTVGDVLLDGWIQVGTAWNGVANRADVGTAAFLALQEGGLFGVYNGWVSLGAPSDYGGLQAAGDTTGIALALAGLALGNTPPTDTRVVPAVFATADPLQLVVSQDPTTVPGVSTGATQGAADLYLVTATPA